MSLLTDDELVNLRRTCIFGGGFLWWTSHAATGFGRLAVTLLRG